MIILIPLGGLANRMRAIDSAMQYTADTGERLFILWIRNRKCKVHFHKVLLLTRALTSQGQCRVKNYHALWDWPLLLLFTLFRIVGMNTYGPHEHDRLRDEIKKKKLRYRIIYSYSKFYNTISRPNFFGLSFSDTVVKKAQSIDWNNVIGVHIRRTDNIESIENSPLDLFIAKIKKELKKGYTKVFLATDDNEVKKILLEMFPNRIHTWQVSYSRNSEEGMWYAAVDLLSLSYCSKILGSYWSSFSETAAEIRDIPLEIVRK